MAVLCVFLTFFSLEAGTAAGVEESAQFLSFHELSELMQALPGFLMLLTGEGKLLYLSESVTEHLGHSMVSTILINAVFPKDVLELHFGLRN